jgi:hypothetical protein
MQLWALHFQFFSDDPPIDRKKFSLISSKIFSFTSQKFSDDLPPRRPKHFPTYSKIFCSAQKFSIGPNFFRHTLKISYDYPSPLLHRKIFLHTLQKFVVAPFFLGVVSYGPPLGMGPLWAWAPFVHGPPLGMGPLWAWAPRKHTRLTPLSSGLFIAISIVNAMSDSNTNGRWQINWQ